MAAISSLQAQFTGGTLNTSLWTSGFAPGGDPLGSGNAGPTMTGLYALLSQGDNAGGPPTHGFSSVNSYDASSTYFVFSAAMGGDGHVFLLDSNEQFIGFHMLGTAVSFVQWQGNYGQGNVNETAAYGSFVAGQQYYFRMGSNGTSFLWDYWNGTAWTNLASQSIGSVAMTLASAKIGFDGGFTGASRSTGGPYLAIYSVGLPPPISEKGTSTGQSTFTGTLKHTKAEKGTSTGQSTFSGTLRLTPNRKLVSATSTGQSTFAGTLKETPNRKAVSATSTGQSTFSGTLKEVPNRQHVTATSVGQSTFTGTLAHLGVDVGLYIDTSEFFVGTQALEVIVEPGVLPRVPNVPGTTNLITNPNGDLGDTYIPYGSGVVVHRVVSTTPVEGSSSILITTLNLPNDQGFSDGPIPIQGGLPYTFSAYLKQVVGINNVIIQVRWMSSLATEISAVQFLTATSGVWQRYNVEGSAPSGAVLAFVDVFFPYGSNAGDQLLVGGMQLEQQTTPTPYTLGTRAPYFGLNNQPWQGASTILIDLVPGEHYVASARIYLGTACPAVYALAFSGTASSVPDTFFQGNNTSLVTNTLSNGWYLVSVPFVATSPIATIVFAVDRDQLPAVRTTAVTYWIDAVVAEAGDIPGSYFDGSSGTGYEWETDGTPGLTRSYYYGDETHRSGVLQSLLAEYTLAGTNVATPQYGVL
jgi:hypothetical protein